MRRPGAPPTRVNQWFLPLLLLICLLTLGWDLDAYRLLDPDEGRNAEVAREMADSNDYVVPHLDGLPYLDKPILFFAAAALSMEVLGPTETAARLPAYLATIATIALLFCFARRRWGPQAGWLAALAYATMPLVAAYARTVIFDSMLAFFITAAIICFYEDRITLGWIAMGFGVLTKGPVAIAVPAAALVPYRLARRQSMRSLLSARALLSFAVVVCPWVLALSMRHSEFLHYVGVRETFERVLTPHFHRTAPIYMYIPVLLLGAFPWIVPALARTARPLHVWRQRHHDASAGDGLLLAFWVIGPLVFFSLIQSKLPQYVLPLMAPLALSASRCLTGSGLHLGGYVYAAFASALALLSLPLAFRLSDFIAPPLAIRDAVSPFALWLGATLLASAAMAAVATRRRSTHLLISGFALVVMALPFISLRLMKAIGQERSAAALAETVAHALPPEGAVVCVATYPPSLPFYLRRRLEVATADGGELTSNYIADYQRKYRALDDSPLKSAAYWMKRLQSCSRPTVFVVRAGDRPRRTILARAAPLLIETARHAAYGPCRPAASKAMH